MARDGVIYKVGEVLKQMGAHPGLEATALLKFPAEPHRVDGEGMKGWSRSPPGLGRLGQGSPGITAPAVTQSQVLQGLLGVKNQYRGHGCGTETKRNRKTPTQGSVCANGSLHTGVPWSLSERGETR